VFYREVRLRLCERLCEELGFGGIEVDERQSI
jgi:hypothetical protein